MTAACLLGRMENEAKRNKLDPNTFRLGFHGVTLRNLLPSWNKFITMFDSDAWNESRKYINR